MPQNYYDILGVPRDVSEGDLKKAYRKLSMQHHPDRETGNTEKFQEINSAYETLSDPNKKGQYDMELNGFPGHVHMNMDPAHDINNMFNMMFGGGGGGIPGFNVHGFGGPGVRIFHNGVQMDAGMNGFFNNLSKPPPIMKHVAISMEQAYQGVSLPLVVERWVLQNNVKNNETETIYINIPPGIDENEMIILKDRGHVLNEASKGDVKLTIQITNNTPFKRMGLDIVYKRTISLKESLCGFSFDLQHLNGKQLCLNNNINKTIIKPNSKKVIPNMGFNRESNTGNLIIDFEVEFPETLTEEQISQIDKILL
jgi:DnaJ-class molecular chaperone